MKCSCDDGVIKMGRNQFDTGFVYDKCPTCNGTGETASKSEIEQLTEDQLREQFERKIKNKDHLFYDDIYPDEYRETSIQDLWSGYIWCARSNGIIK